MNRYDGLRGQAPPDEIGSGPAGPPLQVPRRWLVLAGVLVLAAAVAVVAATGTGHRKLPAARPTARPAARPTVTVDLAGRALLGVTGSWSLLGYGPGQVVLIQFARGRITTTALPDSGDKGPVSFVAGPGQVIIRPLDNVPGYLIPDGQLPRTLTAALSRGGTIVPGPRPATAWLIRPGSNSSAALIQLNGRATGESVRLPAGGPWLASPDGRGYVLLDGPGGFFDEQPGDLRQIAGTVSAVGPTRWLVLDCDRPRRCANIVLNRSGGTRRVLSGPPVSPAGGTPGVIAPDGSAAAILSTGRGGRVSLDLISLTTGLVSRVAVPIGQQTGQQTLAWSPDSTWLFAVTAHGQVVAVSAATGLATSLGIPVPLVTQIAVRP